MDVNISLIGETGVGKSTLRRKAITDVFFESQPKTIGIDMSQISFHLPKIPQADFTSLIFDVEGTRCLSNPDLYIDYFKKTDILLLVFEANRLESLHSTIEWLKGVIKTHFDAEKLLSIVLVGNKIDLIGKKYDMVEKEVEKAIKDLKTFYPENYTTIIVIEL
jgi:GTPase SAR1 family protein